MTASHSSAPQSLGRPTLPTATLFSAAEAREVGIGANELARRVAGGEARRLIRGWYAHGKPGTPADEHLLRLAATLRAADGPAAATGLSAVVAAGLPVYRGDLRIIRTVRGRRLPSRLEEQPGPDDQVIHTVPLSNAIVSVAIQDGGLTALVAADSAVHRRRMTPDELIDALESRARGRRILAARAALRHVDGRHESPGETLLFELFRCLAIRATPQVEITAGGRTDAARHARVWTMRQGLVVVGGHA